MGSILFLFEVLWKCVVEGITFKIDLEGMTVIISNEDKYTWGECSSGETCIGKKKNVPEREDLSGRVSVIHFVIALGPLGE